VLTHGLEQFADLFAQQQALLEHVTVGKASFFLHLSHVELEIVES
jgi:hypothetical protein